VPAISVHRAGRKCLTAEPSCCATDTTYDTKHVRCRHVVVAGMNWRQLTGVLISEVVVIDFVGPELGNLYVKVNALHGWTGVTGTDTAMAGLISSIAEE
jgi:hypothetical protein